LLLLYYDKRSPSCSVIGSPSSFEGVDPATFRQVDDGFEVEFITQLRSCERLTVERVSLHVATDGTVRETARETMMSGPEGCVGRRPEGLRSRPIGASTSALGDHFARMAHLEHASVAAFELLADELAHHGAPAELVAAARSAAADEVRHTATTRELARSFGASPTSAEVGPPPLRSLEAIAIENASEGCVRECFGALLGCYQAQCADDTEIAAAMAEIAEDETRHAELAFAIDAWVQPRLDEGGRARVAAARVRAVSTLRGELAWAPDPSAWAALGWPDPAAALRLHSVLEQTLWVD
jgi:hypothetical protein